MPCLEYHGKGQAREPITRKSVASSVGAEKKKQLFTEKKKKKKEELRLR